MKLVLVIFALFIILNITTTTNAFGPLVALVPMISKAPSVAKFIFGLFQTFYGNPHKLNSELNIPVHIDYPDIRHELQELQDTVEVVPQKIKLIQDLDRLNEQFTFIDNVYTDVMDAYKGIEQGNFESSIRYSQLRDAWEKELTKAMYTIRYILISHQPKNYLVKDFKSNAMVK